MWGSSSAKKADALLRISFARRSSRFSRSSSTSRARSSVVRPGALPASMRACRTEFRSESGTIPSCSPTLRQAALTLSFSAPSTRSSVKRIARSRSSSGYFFAAAMTSILRRLEASINPGAVQTEYCGAGLIRALVSSTRKGRAVEYIRLGRTGLMVSRIALG
jgi:hypothetical protein